MLKEVYVCLHYGVQTWRHSSVSIVIMPDNRGLIPDWVRFSSLPGDRSGTVVKVLCYKSEGRWFDSRWCHWNFSLT